jgi:hypothetical protein
MLQIVGLVAENVLKLVFSEAYARNRPWRNPSKIQANVPFRTKL